MENASKALIMAGGVLIGVLLLTLIVYLFTTFGATSAQINSQNVAKQIAQFNSKFTSYENKEGLTMYDIVTVAGYAKENNEYYDCDNNSYNKNNYYIYVYIGNSNNESNGIQKKDSEELQKLITDEQNLITENNGALPIYKCRIKDYHTNGRVKTIIFTKDN